MEFHELNVGMIGRGIEVTYVGDGMKITAAGTLTNYVKGVESVNSGEKADGWLIMHIGKANGGTEYEQVEEEQIIRMEVA